MFHALLLHEPPLQVLPSLATLIGLNEAIVLQQVHYWLNPKFNKNLFEGRYWVRKTYKQWQLQFPFWSEKTIWRTITKLEKMKILESFVTQDFRKVKYYTINYQALNDLEKEGPPPPFEEDEEHHDGKSHDWGSLDDTQEGKKDEEEKTPQIGAVDLLEIPAPSETRVLPNEEEEEEPFQKLIFAWNKTVQEKLHPQDEAKQQVYLSPKRLQNLKTIFKTVFNNNITTWETYCKKIASYQFLMGKNPSGFKVTLDWALHPDNSYKVLEGALYDKVDRKLGNPLIESSASFEKPEAPPEDPWRKCIQELQVNTPGNPYNQKWLDVCQSLVKMLGETVFKSWFLKVRLKEVKDNTAIIQADTPFRRDYVSNHFRFEVERAMRAVFPNIDYITFQTA